jgi:hypothetical protein
MTSLTVTVTDRVTGEHGSASAPYGVKPWFGIPNPVTNSGATSWASVTAALGPVACERYYFSPPQNVPASSPVPAPGVSRMVVSFRPVVADVLSGALDTAMAALFRTVRPGDCWTAWHEGEAHAGTPADFIAMLSRTCRIFKANAPASARFGQINMSFTATIGSKYRPLSQWISCPANGGTALDFVGIDAYPAAQSDTTWATCIAPVITQVTSVLPEPVWAITEAGDSAKFTDADAGQARFFADGWAWACRNSALTFIPYFGNPPCIWPPGPLARAGLASIAAAART